MEYISYVLLFAVFLLGYGLNQAERKIKELETWTDTINDLERRVSDIEDRAGITYGVEDVS